MASTTTPVDRQCRSGNVLDNLSPTCQGVTHMTPQRHQGGAMRTANYYILGAKRRYWAALAFTVGYSMLLTPFSVRWPL